MKTSISLLAIAILQISCTPTGLLTDTPGIIINPHSGKTIDVKGLAAGTKVADPTTGKTFLVPSDTRKPAVTIPVQELDSSAKPKPLLNQDPIYEEGWVKDTGQGSEKLRFSIGITDFNGVLVAQKSKNQNSNGLPLAIKMPGRTGYVISPHDKGFYMVYHPHFPNRKSGDVVVCPGTGKRFIAPEPF